jgi:hypothetical protein
MSLVLIPRAHVAQTWPLAVPYLTKAERAGAMQGVEDWLGDCLHDRAQLWMVWAEVLSETGTQGRCDGAGLTQLVETPQGRTCIIARFGAKTGSDWLATLPVLEAWAKSQGCVCVRLYGRVGWAEKLKDYALKGVILDRKL